MNYGIAEIVAEGVNADIDTSEEDVIIVPSRESLKYSQFTVYPTIVLGTNTSVILRVYLQNEVDGSWHQTSFYNSTDGSVNPLNYVYTGALGLTLAIDFPVSACLGLKVTAQGAGGADSSVTAKILGRNN